MKNMSIIASYVTVRSDIISIILGEILMKKMIACLHAHHSNIAYLQTSIDSRLIELTHYVDPGLIKRIGRDASFSKEEAGNKVIEQIEWIAQTGVEAILITCTQYSALLEVEKLRTSIPVIKLDEVFFHTICSSDAPQTLLFTNPATINGTMKQLDKFAAANNKTVDNIEVRIIENAFELIMQGKTEQYVEKVSNEIKSILAADKNKKASVVQLSMVESARRVERELNMKIDNPLDALLQFLITYA